MKISRSPLVYLLTVLLLFTICASVGTAKATEKEVDLEKMNKGLDKSIEKDFNGNFPYDPEFLSFEKLETVDEINQVSEYRMIIKTREGTDLIKEDYYYLPVTVVMRDDLDKDNFKGLFGIFTGQSLSNEGGFYSAEFSDRQGAIDGYVVVKPDRTEVNIPEVPENGVTPDEIMVDSGVSMTMADDYIEIAASKLLASEITGIPARDIDTTFMGHSLGAVQLLLHDWSDYQDAELGKINHMIFVDTNVQYNSDGEYEQLKIGQLENYYDLQEQIKSGKNALTDMQKSIKYATKVKNGDFLAREEFVFAISETHYVMSYPPTDDFFYWPSNAPIDDIVNGMVKDDPNEFAIAVPYSPMELEWYIKGMRGGAIQPSYMKNVDSAMYMALGGGFGYSGSQYFSDQEKLKFIPKMDIYDGGNSGHGFMFNDDSRENWEKIWTWTNSQHQ